MLPHKTIYRLTAWSKSPCQNIILWTSTVATRDVQALCNQAACSDFSSNPENKFLLKVCSK